MYNHPFEHDRATQISKKKKTYPINSALSAYLQTYSREVALPLQYKELRHYAHATPLLDKQGNDTLWETVYYAESDMREIFPALTNLYALIKADGDTSVMEHLTVERIDYCTFGNSNPFRVRIKNSFNDNYDYFYVKNADASRVYGLELEHILSPNRLGYVVHQQTLIEEHIAGIPGDTFVKNYIDRADANAIRIAKEFVKFNERCLVKLLGDMRAYNFVIDITPDFDDVQYRIRAIDFDQQCYEGKRKLYMPQFFKENYRFVELCTRYMTPETIRQYQREERALISNRFKTSRYRLQDLLSVMLKDQISEDKKVYQLKYELADYYKINDFIHCQTMGQVLQCSLRTTL